MDSGLERLLMDAAAEVTEHAKKLAQAQEGMDQAQAAYDTIVRIINAGSHWMQLSVLPKPPCIARRVPPDRFDFGPELITGDIGLLEFYEGMEDHHGNQNAHAECWL